MKRPDEEFCKDTFYKFLIGRLNPDTIDWVEVPEQEEPPDYYLHIVGEACFSVEVTSVMESVSLAGRPFSSVGILKELERFCSELNKDAAEQGILRGRYSLDLQPIPRLSEFKASLRERVFQYLADTRLMKTYPRKLVLRQQRARVHIKKVSKNRDSISWNFTGRGKWEREMKEDVLRLLDKAVQDKRKKLRDAPAPRILLILDRYHYAKTRMWTGAAQRVDFQDFHTVARIWQDSSTLILHSQKEDWTN